MKPLLPTIATIALAAPSASAVELSPDLNGYKRSVAPFIEQYCLGCHDADVQKGDVRFDTIDANIVDGRSTDLWKDILHRLETGEMPPEKKPRPSEKARNAAAGWIRLELQKNYTAKFGVPGRVVLRRLSKDEYRHTVKDLLGLDYDIGRELPPDTKHEGYDHIAKAQELSPSQVQTYLEMARFAIDRAIVSGSRPMGFQYRSEPELGKDKPEWRILTHGKPANTDAFEAFKKSQKDSRRIPPNPDEWFQTYRFGMRVSSAVEMAETGVWLPASHQFYRDKFNSWGILSYRLPHRPEGDGLYRLRIRAGADLKEGLGRPIMTINVFKKLLADVDVTASADDPRWYEFVFAERDLKKMPYLQRDSRFEKTPVTDIVINNGYENPGEKPGHHWQVPKETELPSLFIDAVELEYNYHASWPPPSHRQILFESANSKYPEKYATEVLERFMGRAFRHPVRPAELERKLKLFRAAFADLDDFHEAIKEPLVATLISPQFLYLSEDVSADEKKRRQLDDYELASRLSYFLTSTMPDRELLGLASAKELRRPEVLAAQIDRLLDDQRSGRFHRSFMGGWLRLDKLDSIMVEDDRWVRSFQFKDVMREEPAALFGEMLKRDLSLLNFISSDFAMLNERLAIHYKIPGVYGNNFRPVALEPHHHRGGLMTMAANLTSTTDGMITNPIYRGTWVLEKILDRPPPDAPGNVPPLEDAPKERLGLREQFARHRGDANCASCHRRIDPIGWPFERYGLLGDYSETAQGPNWQKFNDRRSSKKFGKPDLHGILPDGTRVETVADLQTFFAKNHRHDVLRSVVKNLLTYALGRPLDLSDEATIKEITQRLERENYSSRTLVHAVVFSRPFLEK